MPEFASHGPSFDDIQLDARAQSMSILLQGAHNHAIEKAAKVAASFAKDIPDADQRVFADVAAAIRKLKVT